PTRSSALLLFPCSRAHRALPSFPTRRSSDLRGGAVWAGARVPTRAIDPHRPRPRPREGAKPQSARRERRRRTAQFHPGPGTHEGDRKSTRLNSSHVAISYAVFCLKKKKETST